MLQNVVFSGLSVDHMHQDDKRMELGTAVHHGPNDISFSYLWNQMRYWEAALSR